MNHPHQDFINRTCKNGSCRLSKHSTIYFYDVKSEPELKSKVSQFKSLRLSLTKGLCDLLLTKIQTIPSKYGSKSMLQAPLKVHGLLLIIARIFFASLIYVQGKCKA